MKHFVNKIIQKTVFLDDIFKTMLLLLGVEWLIREIEEKAEKCRKRTIANAYTLN